MEVQTEMGNTKGNDNGVCGTANIDVSSYTSIEDDIPQNPHAVKWKIPHDHNYAMVGPLNPIDTPTAIFQIHLPPMQDVLVDDKMDIHDDGKDNNDDEDLDPIGYYQMIKNSYLMMR